MTIGEIRSAESERTTGAETLDDVATGGAVGDPSLGGASGISHVAIWARTVLGWSTSSGPSSSRLRFWLPSCAGDAVRRRGDDMEGMSG